MSGRARAASPVRGAGAAASGSDTDSPASDTGSGSGVMHTATGTRTVKEIAGTLDSKTFDPKKKVDMQAAVAALFVHSGAKEKMEDAAVEFLVKKGPTALIAILRAWSDEPTDGKVDDVTAAAKIRQLVGQFEDFVTAEENQERFGDLVEAVQNKNEQELGEILVGVIKAAVEKLNEGGTTEVTELLTEGSQEKAAIVALQSGLVAAQLLDADDTKLASRVVRVIKAIQPYLPNNGAFTAIGAVVSLIVGAVIQNVMSLEGAMAFLQWYTLAGGFVLGLAGDTIKHFVDKSNGKVAVDTEQVKNIAAAVTKAKPMLVPATA